MSELPIRNLQCFDVRDIFPPEVLTHICNWFVSHNFHRPAMHAYITHEFHHYALGMG